MEVAEEPVDDGDGNRFQEVVDALYRISFSVKNMDKKDADCILCTSTIEVSTIEDAVELYSCILVCVGSHVSEVFPIAFHDLFVVEEFILNRVCGMGMIGVNDIFEGTNVKDEKEKILRIVETHSPSNQINIDCEQEFESLMYKVYVRCSTGKYRFSLRDVELLLIVLLRRSEATRFFRVFNRYRKTEGMFRLGLLMSLRDDAFSSDKLLRDMDGYNFSNESYFVDADGLSTKFDPMDLMFARDVKGWLEARKKEIEWEECVHFWSANRDKSSGALDKSMMDLCIKYGKHEEAWVIYHRGCKRTNYAVHKACLLTLKALKDGDGNEWVSRLFEIVEESLASGEDDWKYLIANDILENLPTLPGETGNLVLREFIARMDMSDENEEIINVVIRGLFKLCEKCEDSQELCGNYADKLYNKWKEHKTHDEHFPGDHEKIESEIYSNILGMFDVLNDKHKLFSVCRDLANSNTKITKELCSRLQKVHMVDRALSGSDPMSMEQHATWERLVSLILQKH